MWTINGTRLYVTDLESGENNILPRLQPLNSTTIIQSFGTESPIIKIKAKIVGDTNKDAVRLLFTNKTTCTLSGYSVFYDNSILIRNFSYQISPMPYQFIDEQQDCLTPVFDVSMELYHEDA